MAKALVIYGTRFAREQIAARIESIKESRRQLAESAKEEAKLLARIRAIRGKKWVDVDNIDLKEGKLYMVVKTTGAYGRKQSIRDEPCIAEWTEHGWHSEQGSIRSGGHIDNKLLVWC